MADDDAGPGVAAAKDNRNDWLSQPLCSFFKDKEEVFHKLLTTDSRYGVMHHAGVVRFDLTECFSSTCPALQGYMASS